MFVGFIALAAGVIMSMSYYSSRLMYVLVGLGLILYIIGRIGIHFTPKPVKKEDENIEV
jgi:hypothetical protein